MQAQKIEDVFGHRYALEQQENAVRRLLDLRHSSHMWVIDEALAKMNAGLAIDLPKPKARKKAA